MNTRFQSSLNLITPALSTKSLWWGLVTLSVSTATSTATLRAEAWRLTFDSASRVMWKTGDSATLENLLNEASREAPVVYKRMLTDRNERWVPKLEELLRGDKRVMAIVGAGHLVGPDGVVELLKKRGWKITQL